MDFLLTLRRLFGLDAAESSAERAYRALTGFSRNPYLYREFAVPDTFDGRFDALALHLAIYLAALRAREKDSAEIPTHARRVTEAFLADMDRTLREAGLGDLRVGKEVKRMASALFGRLGAYGRALAAGSDRPLHEALTRNLFRGGRAGKPALDNLAKYARLSYIELRKRPLAELMAGRFDPNPFPVRP